MTMTDPIADMLTRIRNANAAMFDTVKMPSSKLKVNLAKVLEREGFITGFTVTKVEGKPGDTLEINLKYSEDRKKTIVGIKRVSTPGSSYLQEVRPDAQGARRRGRGRRLDEPRTHDRPRSPQGQAGRRGAVLCLVISPRTRRCADVAHRT